MSSSQDHDQSTTARRYAPALIAACLVLGACTVSDRDTTEALQEQGYSNIELRGNSWFGCDEKDTFTRVWVATAQNGARVKGVACSGLLKGVTIRRTGRAPHSDGVGRAPRPPVTGDDGPGMPSSSPLSGD